MSRIKLFQSLFLFVLCFISTVQMSKAAPNKKYQSLVQNAIQSSSGFITVQLHSDKLFLEIPDSIFGRELLLASRVEELSSTKNAVAGQMIRNPLMVTLSHDDSNVYLHSALNPTSVDSDDPIHISFQRNNMQTIMHVFKIETKSSDKNTIVIDATKFFNSQITQISPFGGASLGKSIPQSTKTIDARAYDTNVELVTQMGFVGKRSSFMCSLHRSIVLLPEIPMQARLASKQIGYYEESKKRLSSDELSAESYAFVKRWRLEPKAEDIDRFKNGELVEPKKPIVFYLDDAIPAKWKPYIKAGIEDWQSAFEAIGFKNAIVAKDYPKNDPNFHPNDFTNSCFRYVATEKANAMGNHWVDPRSGEILQGDVLFYHGVFKKLYQWRFSQTAANDPSIRGNAKDIDPQILGNLVRYAAAHEIGHSLGLKHNYRSSFSYPVDSLRSASFTEKFGTTASIMDYARNNYIAQPQDQNVSLTPPILGVYDMFSIKWAYQPIYSGSTIEEQKLVMDQWIEGLENDDMYLFGTKNGMGDGCLDPSVLSESLGDDLIEASRYGVSNAKLIVSNLMEWTDAENISTKDLQELYRAVVKQYNQYMKHAESLLGGMYEFDVTNETHPDAFVPVTKEEQQEALNFMLDELLSQHDWLINSEYNKRVGPQERELLKSQGEVVKKLINRAMFTRMFTCASYSESPYSVETYLEDITNKLFTVSKEKQATYWMKNIQIEYVKLLLKQYTEGLEDSGHVFNTIISSNLHSELESIHSIAVRLAQKGHDSNKSHFRYLKTLTESYDSSVNNPTRGRSYRGASWTKM